MKFKIIIILENIFIQLILLIFKKYFNKIKYNKIIIIIIIIIINVMEFFMLSEI